jgi:hypothetical protein
MGTRETLMNKWIVAPALLCGIAASAASAEMTRATISSPPATYAVPDNSVRYVEPAATTYAPPASSDVIIVDVAPPADRVEVVPAAREGYVWAPGYWTWDGSSYAWVDGRYVPALAGYRYVAPRWESVDGHYVLRSEQWMPDTKPNPLGNARANPLTPSPGQ